jgi:pimeloyl-ACP methyl ester carboxylesterase
MTTTSQVIGDRGQSYVMDAVRSEDGTTIGYRQFGAGPGLVLVHGGLQTSLNFVKLAELLADAFTVYVPDRRGRGLSGPCGETYGMKTECDDLNALLCKTGAHNVFGLSSGALIALQAAYQFSAIHMVALYEPPLPLDDDPSPPAWVTRYEREIANGNLGAAFVAVIKGTGDPSLLTRVPRVLLVPLMQLVLRTSTQRIARQGGQSDEVPLQALIPTMQYDAQIVQEMSGRLATFQTLTTEVLLLGGDKSAAFLQAALVSLSKTLPHARRVIFHGLGHLAADNSGKPERVAAELRPFFLRTRN